jgi:integrase
MKLTAKTVATPRLPVGKSDHIDWDDDLPGFGHRLRSGGDRIRGTYIVQYRTRGRTRRFLLGSTDVLGAEQARAAAKKVLAEVALGGDPQSAKQAQRRADDQNLRATITIYLEAKRAEVRRRTFREIERYLRGPHFGSLHAQALDQITRRDVAGCLARIVTRNGSVTAGRARATLSTFYSWAMGRGLAESNPVIGTNKPVDSKPRDRVLSDSELVVIWQACLESSYGRIIKLLALTGCRREEVGGMCWDELDLEQGTWTISAARAKNGRTHILPLPPAALDILAAVERVDGRNHLFGGYGGHGFQRWSASKRELDIRSGVSGWTVHDIRRTVATRMADIGVQPHVIEAVLNHQSGHKRGPAGVYNRSSYEREVKAALALWAERVIALVEGREQKIMPLDRLRSETR